MAGRRPLTTEEERNLRRILESSSPRDAALVTTQWLSGFRISECLSLKVRDVVRNGTIVNKIGIRPAHLKGHYGATRWVPVLPALHRALDRYLRWLLCRHQLLPDMPLFLSRETQNGDLRALSRESARRILQTIFSQANVTDDGRLGTHSLRKTFARHVYQNSGNDLMVLKAALGHSSVSITQAYLEVQEDDVVTAIQACDRSRKPKLDSSPRFQSGTMILERLPIPTVSKTGQILFDFSIDSAA